MIQGHLPIRILAAKSSYEASLQLSRLILNLYDAAKACTLDEFLDQSMTLLSSVVRFDGSFSGRSRLTPQGVQVHFSHLRNLPVDVPLRLNAAPQSNTVALCTRRCPDTALVFDRQALAAEPNTAELARYMNAAQALSISSIDDQTGLGYFVSLTRGPGRRRFDEADRRCVSLLWPHLVASLDLCCRSQLEHLLDDGGATLASAICDPAGYLHGSEPGFAGMLSREWSHWSGRRLPQELVDCVLRRAARFRARALEVTFEWLSGHAVLRVGERRLADELSDKEREVALTYAAGYSYKEVARKLGLAPATVQHHLRSVYLKLAVRDKGALATALARH